MLLILAVCSCLQSSRVFAFAPHSQNRSGHHVLEVSAGRSYSVVHTGTNQRGDIARTSIPSLEQYQRTVHALRIALDRLAPGGGSAQAAKIAVQLRSLGEVQISAGRTIQTSTPDLAAQVTGGGRTSARRVAREIDRLDSALRTQPVAPAAASELAALDSVLRDSRFHPQQNLFQQFGVWIWQPVQWVLDRIQQLLQNVQPGGELPTGLLLLIALAFVLAVAGLAVLLGRAAIARVTGTFEPAADSDEPTSVRLAQARADAMEVAGDLRSALRYVLLATMLELGDRGVLELRPGLTNREYLHRFRVGPHAGPSEEAFAELVELFDRTWYGHQPIDRTAYERGRELGRQALRTARERIA